MVKRVIVYCLGLLCLAFGVSFSIKSNLGVSPINSIPYVLSLVTGKGQGLITTVIFSLYVVMQILLLRKEFQIKNLLQLIFASLFGSFVTFSNDVLKNLIVPDLYLVRLCYLVISIVLVALGLLLYLSTDIVPQPPEGLMLAISKKTGIKMSKIKVIFDCTVVVIAAAISLIAFKEMRGVREGTIISAILIGKVLELLSVKWKKTVVDFTFS